MAINYSDRKIFWGNELLIVGDLVVGDDKAVSGSNLELVTGLVSVGAMENQAEIANYPADDVADHGTKKGSTLLQGEMVFIQTDQTVRQSLMGQQQTANGLGWSPTGNYSNKCVQYLHKAQRVKASDGSVETGYMITVYPNLKATSDATKESETDSVDGVDPIQWTLAVQATDSDKYLNQGKKVPSIEYEVWGEQATEFMKKMEDGLFFMFPDTIISGGMVLTAPTIADVETATHGGADATVVIPTTLKNQNGENITVTHVIQKSTGEPATNGSLGVGTYTVIFSAVGYPEVSTTFAVTDKP